MNLRLRAICLTFCCALTLLAGCTSAPGAGGTATTPLVVFAAGSLILPFGDLEAAFESQHPDIDVQAEYHGSIQVMRHATELGEPIDVVATADAALIPMLMYADDPQTGQPYADWYMRFASNRLALAYQPDSLYQDEIDAGNWYAILTRPDVRVGIPDPRFDAAGYRALMAFALAGEAYQDPLIFMDMFNGEFTYPLGYFRSESLTTITVPEIVETAPGAHIVIRGASIQLVALLQSGDLDYAFEYESVIRQHDLGLLSLPDEINLGVEGYDYGTVQVNLDFQRFATVEPQFRGERIGYGITVPAGAPHPGEAALFIAFLFGPQGRAIMQENFHPMFDPLLCDQPANLPADLRALCAPGDQP